MYVQKWQNCLKKIEIFYFFTKSIKRSMENKIIKYCNKEQNDKKNKSKIVIKNKKVKKFFR